MTALIVTYPPELVFSRFSLDLVTAARDGGQSLSGLSQVTSGLASLWRLTATVPLDTPSKIRRARRLQAAMRGRVNILKVNVRAVAMLHTPFYQDGVDPFPGGDPNYALGALTPNGPLPVAGATTVSVIDDSGLLGAMGAAPLINGSHLAIGDYTYMCQLTVNGGAAHTYNISIWPPLRVTPDPADVWQFGAVLLCRPRRDDAWNVTIDGQGHGEDLALDLYEVLP